MSSSTTDRPGDRMDGRPEQEQSLVDDVSAKAQEAVSAAEEKASELKERGSRSLGETLDEKTTEAGSQARALGQALRRAGEEVGRDGRAGAARLADEAAERLEGLGSYLERKRGGELLSDAEQFARRRPWAVAGLGLVTGLVASRFLKASAERRHHDLYAGDHGSPRARGAIPAGAGRDTGGGHDLER